MDDRASAAAGRRPDRHEAAPGPRRLAACRAYPYFKVSQHARGQFSRPAVLHMAFTYFPDEVGGTEIHVAALIRALRAAA